MKCHMRPNSMAFFLTGVATPSFRTHAAPPPKHRPTRPIQKSMLYSAAPALGLSVRREPWPPPPATLADHGAPSSLILFRANALAALARQPEAKAVGSDTATSRHAWSSTAWRGHTKPRDQTWSNKAAIKQQVPPMVKETAGGMPKMVRVAHTSQSYRRGCGPARPAPQAPPPPPPPKSVGSTDRPGPIGWRTRPGPDSVSDISARPPHLPQRLPQRRACAAGLWNKRID
jgi:hypothetical protein